LDPPKEGGGGLTKRLSPGDFPRHPCVAQVSVASLINQFIDKTLRPSNKQTVTKYAKYSIQWQPARPGHAGGTGTCANIERRRDDPAKGRRGGGINNGS